jgi:glycosyltransferase involved in cell wall biosynthesis
MIFLSRAPRGVRPLWRDYPLYPPAVRLSSMDLRSGLCLKRGALRCRTPLIALVHQPLALDPGLDPTQADTFRETERAALAAAARVVVTSEATARIVRADYDVPSQNISVVRPGNDVVPPALGSSDGVIRLLSVGSVVPVKGYDLLVVALATLTDMPWQLTIAGDRTRDPLTAAQLEADIAGPRPGRQGPGTWRGTAQRINELFLASDIFVLASRFEGYGMALAEAIAHGIPVVSTMAGAIPQTVPAGTGLLVPPDDAAALAFALRRLISDPAERRRLAANARTAAVRLPTWQESAKLFVDAIESSDGRLNAK